jgi:hypothetical protein
VIAGKQARQMSRLGKNGSIFFSASCSGLSATMRSTSSDGGHRDEFLDLCDGDADRHGAQRAEVGDRGVER